IPSTTFYGQNNGRSFATFLLWQGSRHCRNLRPRIRNAFLLGLVILSAGLVLKGSDHDCPAYPASKWSFNPDTLENQAQAQDLMTMRLAKSVPDVAFAVSLTC